MNEIQVFEDTSAFGSSTPGEVRDPTAVRFASDVDWLRAQGVSVTRYDRSRHPEAFVANPEVNQALTCDSTCLPLIVVDGKMVSRGVYPSREDRAEMLGLKAEEPVRVLTSAVKEIIGLAAACVTSDEDASLYYFRRARRLGVPDDELHEAVVTALVALEMPTREVMDRFRHLLVEVAGVLQASRPIGCWC